VCNVSFIVCVALCAVFCLSVVCYLCDMCIFVCCVLLQYHPFEVQLNSNNNNNNNNEIIIIIIIIIKFLTSKGKKTEQTK
jgi:hypothetical protein